LLYSPPTNYVGLDAFSYTNRDCAGLTSFAQVLVSINPLPHPFTLTAFPVQVTSNGLVSPLLLQGIAGYTYTLQRANAWSGSDAVWSNVAGGTPGTDPTNSGTIFFYDTNPPSPSFYRAKQP